MSSFLDFSSKSVSAYNSLSRKSGWAGEQNVGRAPGRGYSGIGGVYVHAGIDKHSGDNEKMNEAQLMRYELSSKENTKEGSLLKRALFSANVGNLVTIIHMWCRKNCTLAARHLACHPKAILGVLMLVVPRMCSIPDRASGQRTILYQAGLMRLMFAFLITA